MVIGTINYDCNILLTDLDFSIVKENSIVKEAKLIEIKSERQSVSERLIDVIKRLLFNIVLGESYGFYGLYLD